MRVTFKAKPEKRWSYDAEGAATEYLELTVPEIERKHCDMRAFRMSRRFGGFANSDMFPAMVRRAVAEVVGPRVRLDQAAPAGVTVQPGFLHTVTIELAEKA